ncbi:MAG: ATP-binding cassette domain-containing protein [Deltaproteobacteria bacterium]|nr:ATP-binding cassette domain-containing protein [Deltaproteobacteria bacterium]MBI3295650.1 ATP-binding cassette domain-containing protein [Deltaproteobacteria bacterium]
MIEFVNVTKRFEAQAVLEKMSLTIEKGEIVFLIGRSGVGKSVSLKCLVGLLKLDAGEIRFDGRSTAELDEKEWMGLRRRCSLIFQNPALIDSMTIYDNLALGIRAMGLAASRSNERGLIEREIAQVGLDLSLLKRYPLELSHSTQKRVSVARALVVGSEALLFDEPTTGLDPINTARINQLIEGLGRAGRTIWVVSHDMHCALAVADRILLLEGAHIAADLTPKTIRSSNHPLIRQFLEEADARPLH